jgi:hypothetical protein
LTSSACALSKTAADIIGNDIRRGRGTLTTAAVLYQSTHTRLVLSASANNIKEQRGKDDIQ